MPRTGPAYSKEEFARRGDAIYDRTVRPRMRKRDEGKFVAIDIESGAFEIGSSEIAACDRLEPVFPIRRYGLRALVSKQQDLRLSRHEDFVHRDH
jgi:hypothetical protein